MKNPNLARLYAHTLARNAAANVAGIMSELPAGWIEAHGLFSPEREKLLELALQLAQMETANKSQAFWGTSESRTARDDWESVCVMLSGELQLNRRPQASAQKWAAEVLARRVKLNR